MLGGEGGERLVVAEQALAPGFEAPVLRRRLRRMAGHRFEPLAQRRGVDLAHQAADVLHLAALRFVARDPLRLEHRLAQPFFHR